MVGRINYTKGKQTPEEGNSGYEINETRKVEHDKQEEEKHRRGVK